MAIQAPCPHCHAQLAVADALAGKTVRCGKCAGTFAMPAPVPMEEPVLDLELAEPAVIAIAATPNRTAAARPPLLPSPRDDRPTSRRPGRPAQRGAMGFTMALLAVGALVLVLVACTGVVGVGIGWFASRAPVQEPVAAVKMPARDVLPKLDQWEEEPPRMPRDEGPPPAPQPPIFMPPPDVERKLDVPPKTPAPPEQVVELPPFKEAPNPFRPGTQTRLRAVGTIKAPGNAVQLVYAPRHELLFLRNSGSSIWVLDVKTGKTLGMRAAQDTFTDMSLAPDESTLFAADYGGTNIGYATARQPSHIHRHDLADREWESRTAPKIAFRIEAVDRNRFLLLEQDQWVSLSLNRWQPPGGGVTELARIGCSYAGDIEYDPRTGRVYHGNSGISSPEITVRRIAGSGLNDAGNTGTYGTASKTGGGSATLAVDGSSFYYGRLQVEALDVRHNLKVFPEIIIAATRDLAFGKKSYYNAETAQKVGNLPFEPAALTLSRDGMVLWACDPATTTLHRFALEGER